MEELVEDTKSMSPFVTEGYVLCSEKFERVKIAAPMFISICYLGFNNGSIVNGLPSLIGEEVDEKRYLFANHCKNYQHA